MKAALTQRHMAPHVQKQSVCNKQHVYANSPASAVLILAAILDLVLVLVFRRKCILVLVTFSHFYPA